MRDLGQPGECDRYGAVMTINALATDAVLDDAYTWHCQPRPAPVTRSGGTIIKKVYSADE